MVGVISSLIYDKFFVHQQQSQQPQKQPPESPIPDRPIISMSEAIAQAAKLGTPKIIPSVTLSNAQSQQPVKVTVGQVFSVELPLGATPALSRNATVAGSGGIKELSFNVFQAVSDGYVSVGVPYFPLGASETVLLAYAAVVIENQ